MDLKDLSVYLTGLLRSEPEVITAFFMGILLSGMLGFWLRHRLLPSYDAGVELARRDADIARRDTDLARKDAHIAAVEAKLAIVESRLSEEERLVVTLRRQGLVLLHPDEHSRIERFAALEADCAELSAENLRLRQDRQSAEAVAADLRAKLAQARDEVDHWAKWARVYEENAQLLETGSLKEG
jgi:chromosome segregation ATPase